MEQQEDFILGSRCIGYGTEPNTIDETDHLSISTVLICLKGLLYYLYRYVKKVEFE